MKSRSNPSQGAARRDRLIRELEHDPYGTRRKPSEPTVCPECGAVFRDGRWRWDGGAFDAPQSLCPACQRARDGYPAGEVRASGAFLVEHREEILSLARHVEAREKDQHPLKRIMDITDEGEELVIRTTDMNLARAIGDAIHHAYAGELEYRYADEERFLRVHWSR